MGIYPGKTILEIGHRYPMFIAALFTIVRTSRKPPRCPSMDDEWVEKLWIHAYDGILLIATERDTFGSVLMSGRT